MKQKHKDAPLKTNPATEAPRAFVDLGQKLEKLGKALQDAETDMRTLSDLSFDVGLQLDFHLEDPGRVTVEARDLRSECDQYIIKNTELQDQLQYSRYECTLLKAMTGITKISYARDEKGEMNFVTEMVPNTPFGRRHP